jgi:UDP-N-acetylglucosamine 4,6-dehydratase
MRGGEIFIPKIPSMKITDLARAISADSEQEIVGIRPGEKLHELLLTRDDARNTIEFKDYYIISPNIHMWDTSSPTAYGGEHGQPVAADFEYASNTNDRWFDVEQLRAVIA